MSYIFKEADLKAVGGLSPRDRTMPALEEIMQLALVAVPQFKEAVGGRIGPRGVSRWFAAAQHACQRMREANGEGALGFLLRKGVQTIANDWYQAAPGAWRQYCEIVGSDGVAEWYAPLYPSTLPAPVDRAGEFPKARVQGEESALVNVKFGAIEPFERELFDDDKTGQIRQRASRLGAAMPVTESVWAASRFIGAARTYANLVVPASRYTTTDINGTAVTGPWSSTLYSASTGNRPATYLPLNIGRLKVAYQASINAVDPLQNKLVITPNVLLHSAMDALNVEMLLAPGAYPGVMGQSDAAAANAPVIGGTVSAAGVNQGVLAGYPGGAFAPNPFAKLGIKGVMERYLADWAWALGEGGKGIVFQERDPLEITQEAPNTGSNFTFDVIQFRSRRRFEVDWVGGGSRFWYLGNDGTATGVL